MGKLLNVSWVLVENLLNCMGFVILRATWNVPSAIVTEIMYFHAACGVAQVWVFMQNYSGSRNLSSITQRQSEQRGRSSLDWPQSDERWRCRHSCPLPDAIVSSDLPYLSPSAPTVLTRLLINTPPVLQRQVQTMDTLSLSSEDVLHPSTQNKIRLVQIVLSRRNSSNKAYL